MGIFNDIKKVLFGAKSVTRSAGHAASEMSDEFMDSVKEKGNELYEKTRKGADKLTDKAEDAVDSLMDKYKSWRSDISKKSDHFNSEMSKKHDEATTEADLRMEQLRERAASFRKELEDDEKEYTEDEIKETLKHINDEKEAIQQDLKDKAEDIRHKAETLSNRMEDKIHEEFEKVNSASERIKDSTEAIGESILTGAADMLERLRHGATTLSDNLEKKSEEIQKKATSYLYDKDESGQSLVDKAKVNLDNLKLKWQNTIDKAQQAARDHQNKKDKPYQPETDDKAKLKKSELDDKDEFWRKAEAFAAGDYDRVKEVKLEMTDEVSSAKTSSTAPGFIDEDGDGNEIIDDAIVINEEE